MSSASNLDTNTLGVPPKAGDEPCRCGKHTVKGHASLTLAHTDNAAELLDMLGLPPRERTLRSYNPKHRPNAEGSGT